MIGWHLSNRFFDLEPIVGRLAQDAGWQSLIRAELQLSKAREANWNLASEWLCVAAQNADFGGLGADRRWKPARTDAPLWTDEYSSLWKQMHLW